MINYDKQFNAKINSIVRQFNAKVTRLEKQGLKHIPQRVSVSSLKASYFERDALKRRLRQLQKFSERGAEKIVELGGGAKATKWQVETLKSDMAYMKRYYGKEIQRYGSIIPNVAGKKQAVSYAEMGSARYENYKVLRKSMSKNINKLDQSDFNKMVRKTQAQIKHRQKQKYVLWQNYFTFIEDVGYKADVDEKLIFEIEEKINRMNIDKFIEFFETEKIFSGLIDDYEIQKMKADGFDSDKKKTIQDNFEDINKLLDEYM